MNNVFIGFDTRMPMAWGVAARSLIAKSGDNFNIHPILLPQLHALGYYTRPTIRRDGNLYDVISSAPMSTQFAISRFFVPLLSEFRGWSLFCDSDFLFRHDAKELFDNVDNSKAVMVVKHRYAPDDGIKMDGQAQTAYPRKNWSSLIMFNCGHPTNKYLTPENLNKDRGISLHGFHWIPDEEIGEIKEEWNWLEGHSSMEIVPKCVHFTRGTPDMDGYKDVPYAGEWNNYAMELPLCK